MNNKILRWLFSRYHTEFREYDLKYAEKKYENKLANIKKLFNFDNLPNLYEIIAVIEFADYYFGWKFGTAQMRFLLNSELNKPHFKYELFRQEGKTSILICILLTIISIDENIHCTYIGLNQRHAKLISHTIQTLLNKILLVIDNPKYNRDRYEHVVDQYSGINFTNSNNMISVISGTSANTIMRGTHPDYIFIDEHVLLENTYDELAKWYPRTRIIAVYTSQENQFKREEAPHWVNKKVWDTAKTQYLKMKEE